MRTIELTKGKVTIVDDEDACKISSSSWHYTGNGYAAARINYKIVFMHRLLCPCPKGMEVDHINRNRLDNRKSNLRVVTKHENRINKSMKSSNKSGYKGVFWDTRRKRFLANISVNGKTIFLGRFFNKGDAALAYNDAAVKYFGKFAVLNQLQQVGIP